jgi:hypothetical protein
VALSRLAELEHVRNILVWVHRLQQRWHRLWELEQLERYGRCS